MIVDDALKGEQEDMTVWNPEDEELSELTPPPTPVDDETLVISPFPMPVEGETSDDTDEDNLTENLFGTPTPEPAPTPSTGWVEYDDDWWEEHVGGNDSGYDDFYE